MGISLIIPTYNEKDNISELVKELRSFLDKHAKGSEIIIVDDNSPDGTGDIVDRLAIKDKNLHVVHRSGKLGLSSAVIAGIAVSHKPLIGVMDADFSHPIAALKPMAEAIDDGADFVIGSRYIRGGKIYGWTFFRKLQSRVATLLARPLTRAKDPMSGFILFKKKCIAGIDLNSKGFKICLELLMKSNYQTLAEVPIVFINRKKGKSKASTKEVFFLLNNLKGYLFSRRPRRKSLKVVRYL
jgi:dolichol-phosphate mannosyltransferase